MDKKDFKNRKVDKVPINKSKDYLWKYIKAKTDMKAKESFSFTRFFQSLFAKTPKFAYAAPLAILLVFALLFTNLSGIFDGGGINVDTVHASFEMTADEEDSSGVESESTFTLTASENYSEDNIGDYLKVYPEIDFSVNKTGEGKYSIIPEGKLESNKIYNFTIDSTAGEFSWAYQIKDTFKIKGSIPGDKSNYVSTSTGVEINFSHENYDFENIEDYFSIYPSVDGYFENHRNTLVFVPEDGFEETTIYTVIIKEGLALTDSNQKLEEDYVFHFETDQSNYSYDYMLKFIDDNHQIASNSTVALDVYMPYDYDQWGDYTLDVKVYKFNTADDFLSSFNENLAIPSWCFFGKKDFFYDKSNLEFVGTFEALIDEVNWTNYLYLPNTVLNKGYYLVEIGDVEGEDLSQTLLQITDLSSYISATLTDTLVWVNDVDNGESVDNAKVEVLDTDISAETNKEGIANFTTPEDWNVLYNDVSRQILKISSSDDLLFVDLNPYYDDYLGSRYWQLFSTDRTKYKASDKVKFWGYLKPKTDNVSTDNLRLELNYNFHNFIKEVPIKIDGNTFIGEIDLNEYSSSGWYDLQLYNGDDYISSVSFEVEDYTKPSYDLIIESDKKAVFAGEEINLSVKAEFFDGTPVPNLKLSNDYSDIDQQSFVTDKNGEVKFTQVEDAYGCQYDYCYNSHNVYYELRAVLAEITDIVASTSVRVFESKVNINAVSKVFDNKAEITIYTNDIDLSKINNDDDTSYYDYLGDIAPNQIIYGDITEYYWEKVEDGEYYDFINKKTVTQYRYDKQEKSLGDFTVTTNNHGEASYDFIIEDSKYYRVELRTEDENANNAYENITVYGSSGRSSESDYYMMKILNGEDFENTNSWWDRYSKVFDIGERVEMAFANDEVPLEEGVDGRFLYLQLSNGLIDYEVSNSPSYNFDFTKNHLPNVNISGVWFDGNKYHTTYSESVDYKYELDRLNLEINFDKENYSPGDEVSLEVYVKDQDGDPVKSHVNLNLVDEAFYKIAYDNFEDPLAELYSNNSTGVLSSYDSHDNVFAADSMEKSGMGGCFTGDTQILMADGSYKAIKDIQKGDLILTKDHEFSSRLVPGKVVETFEHLVDNYLIINGDLEVTEEHVVFVNGAWNVAGELQVGDSLLGKNGENIEIYSIEEITRPVYVYNFEVEEKHTYFANDFYVHNDKGEAARTRFEDTALFELVETNRSGYAKVEFTLPDNITSWRVMTKAIDGENLAAGYSIDSLKVSLPFFADLIMNDEYSINDDPLIKFRAYGEDLSENDKVDFQIVAESLGLEESEIIEGKAYEGSYYDLPKLELGKHDISLFAESSAMEDSLMKSTNVMSSRLKETTLDFIKTVDPNSKFNISEEGPTLIKFLDSGITYHYYDLYRLYYSSGDRLDQRLSKIIAAELLNDYFHEDLYIDDSDIVLNYQNGGLLLLPYADDDLKLSALTLAFENDLERYNKFKLINYFEHYLNSDDINYDELTLGLLGLASLNEPVLLNLRFLKEDANLDIAEMLYIGLAFDQLGSKADAEKILDEVLGDLAEDNPFETALAAILAASLERDQEAALLWEFVEIHGIEDDLTNLYELAYIKNSLRHLSSEKVKFNLKINEHNETVDLEKNHCYGVMVYPGDSVSVNVKDGQLGAYIHYEKAIDPEDFKKDNNINIDRNYYSNGVELRLKEGDLVNVVINVSVPEELYVGHIFKITDILPSGLKLMSRTSQRNYETDDYPYRVDGQEIYFYWNPYLKDAYGNKGTKKQFKYSATVVNPGVFYADPAKIESFYDESMANITEELYINIEKN